MALLERFFPDIYVKSVFELPLEDLKKLGIRGLESVVILNRYDAGIYGSSIEEVITAPHQFAYSEESPATAELIELADDVLQRWWAEKTGETNVGRTLPEDYFFFEGDGAHNHYRTTYEKTGETWDWSYTDPYNA